MEESRDQERARKLRYGLVDFSEVTDMKVTPDDIRRIVEANRKTAVLTPGAIVAIIAPSELPYALSRLWHTLSDDLGWQANVFHTRQDAIGWLRNHLDDPDAPGAFTERYPSLNQAQETGPQ